MKAFQFDVVIVGGGPAGTATALSLLKSDPDLNVALLEKTSHEKKRVGEILKPSAQSLLEQLGVWQAFLDEKYSLAGNTRTIWGAQEPLDKEFIPQPEDRGWEIDRRAFDTLLFNLADQKGAHTFANHELVDYEKDPAKGWLLNVQGPNQEKITFKASFLVDASGQSPIIAPKQGAKKVRFDRLVGVFVIFNNKDSINPDSCVLAETSPHGWWYSILLPDDLIIAAFMTDNDLVGNLELIKSKKWWDLLKESHHTYDRVKSSIPVSDFCVRIADSYYLDQVQGEGWASVGDATARLDPLSGHGIYWAMQSGIYASHSIVNWLRGDNCALTKYQEQIDEEYQNYLFERMCVYSLEKRWVANPFWQRRQDTAFMDPSVNSFLTKAKRNATQLKKFHFFHGFQDKISL